jgi:hypothetical protein
MKPSFTHISKIFTHISFSRDLRLFALLNFANYNFVHFCELVERRRRHNEI